MLLQLLFTNMLFITSTAHDTLLADLESSERRSSPKAHNVTTCSLPLGFELQCKRCSPTDAGTQGLVAQMEHVRKIIGEALAPRGGHNGSSSEVELLIQGDQLSSRLH